jgi:hypothetical protein
LRTHRRLRRNSEKLHMHPWQHDQHMMRRLDQRMDLPEPFAVLPQFAARALNQ